MPAVPRKRGRSGDATGKGDTTVVTTPRNRIRLSWLIAGLVCLAAAGGYSAYWYFAAGQMRDLVTRWIADSGNAGLAVEHQAIETQGFPTLITLNVDRPAVASTTGGWAWSADRVSFSVKPWDLTLYRIEMPRRQFVEAKLNDGPWRFVLESEDAFALAALRLGGALEFAELQLAEPVLTTDRADSPLYSARRLAAKIGLPEHAPALHTDTLADVSMVVEGLTLPARLNGPLGTDVSRLRLDAAMRGPLEDGVPATVLDDWRAKGGTVDLNWLHLAWGPVDLKSSGTLSLDETLRPIGALKADIAGYAEVIEAFVGAGMIGEDTGRLFKTGLSLIAKKPPDGGPSVISVPLTAQDGNLFLGPFKIAELPPLVE